MPRRMSVTPPAIHTRPPRREGNHRPSITGSSRASACGSTSAGTTRRRPFLRTISSLSCGLDARDASTADAGGAAATATGMNIGVRIAPSSPRRNCRRHIVKKDRETPWRRAVALACRCPTKLSSTIRSLSASLQCRRCSLSASLQCRRRTPSAAERTSISGLNVRSAIRSDVSPPPKIRQTAIAGGIPNKALARALTALARARNALPGAFAPPRPFGQQIRGSGGGASEAASIRASPAPSIA